MTFLHFSLFFKEPFHPPRFRSEDPSLVNPNLDAKQDTKPMKVNCAIEGKKIVRWESQLQARIRNVYPGSGMFIPDPECFFWIRIFPSRIPDSQQWIQKEFQYFYPKIVTKLFEIWSKTFIPDRIFFSFRTPAGGVKSTGFRISDLQQWNRRIQTWRLCGRDSWRGWDRCPRRRSRACPSLRRGRARRACLSRGAATSPTSAARPASWTRTQMMFRKYCTDPDPDPHFFCPPGSGSISQKYGSGSFYQ